MLLQDAFEINPRVQLPDHQELPFIPLERLVPGQRNVEATITRRPKGGTRFEVGDTLMARITPSLENGKIARYLPRNPVLQQATGSTEFIVLRGRPKVSTSAFAYYLACSPTFHDSAVALMTGTSGRQRVDLAGFKRIEVALPSLSEQKAITDVLGALDDKIDSNNRTVAISIKLCSSIIDKFLNGTTVPLSTIADIKMGTSPKGKFLNELGQGKPFFQGVRDFGPIFPTNRVFTEQPVREAAQGDILFAVRAPIGQVNITNEDCAIGRGIASFQGHANHLTLFYLLYSQPQIWEIFQGTGTIFSSINKADLQDAKIPWVSNPALIETTIKPIHERAMGALRENCVLANTRDELLPLLIDGQITVDEAIESIGPLVDEKRIR